jgi:hypothetical protein
MKPGIMRKGMRSASEGKACIVVGVKERRSLKSIEWALSEVEGIKSPG